MHMNYFRNFYFQRVSCYMEIKNPFFSCGSLLSQWSPMCATTMIHAMWTLVSLKLGCLSLNQGSCFFSFECVVYSP